MNLLVEVEIKLHTEFGRVWLKKKWLLLCLRFFGGRGCGGGGGVGCHVGSKSNFEKLVN